MESEYWMQGRQEQDAPVIGVTSLKRILIIYCGYWSLSNRVINASILMQIPNLYYQEFYLKVFIVIIEIYSHKKK